MNLLTLPDGRTLEVEMTGPRSTAVLLFHDGTPGGSTQLRPWPVARTPAGCGW